MEGDGATVTGAGLVIIGVPLLVKGVDLVSTDLTTGIASIGVGAGLMIAGFIAIRFGLLKASVAKVAKTFKL